MIILESEARADFFFYILFFIFKTTSQIQCSSRGYEDTLIVKARNDGNHKVWTDEVFTKRVYFTILDTYIFT